MRTFYLPLLFVACVPYAGNFPQKVYVSKCGIEVYAKTSEGFQEFEDKALEVLGPAIGLSCSDLSGWIISVVPYADETGAFYDTTGQKVAGLNYWSEGKIEIGTTDWKKSALAHELVHIKLHSELDTSHVGWGDGINQAIDLTNQ
jgi:hypothetical protein